MRTSWVRNLVLVAVVALGLEADASLLVSSLANDRVLSYSETDGTFLGDFVTAGSGGLVGPKGIAFGPDGSLYVSSSGTDQILRYDGTTGASLGVFVDAGSGGLGNPFDIAFGPDGNLYVASVLNSSILRYDGLTGAFIDVFAHDGLPADLNFPRGMTFGNNRLYVSAEGDRVHIFDATTGLPLGSFLSDNPRGLAVGADGMLYVADGGPASLIERRNATTGAYIDTFVPHESGGMTGPLGIRFGPDGSLYVASRGQDAVYRYDGITGAFLDVFVTSGSGGLDDPQFLAFSPVPARVVPEPSTLASAALAMLIGLGVAARGKKRRSR